MHVITDDIKIFIMAWALSGQNEPILPRWQPLCALPGRKHTGQWMALRFLERMYGYTL